MTAVQLTSLGNPVEGARLWVQGLVPRTGGGTNWIGQFYNFPNANPTEWIVGHLSGLDAGTYNKYEDTLPSSGNKGRYADTNYTKITNQIRAANGRVYWPAISTFGWYYDPTDEQVHEMPQLPVLPGESDRDDAYYDAIFDVPGTTMWWGTVQAAGASDHRPQIVSVNPINAVVTQWGRVGSMDHTLAAYAYYIHADGAGTDWVYVLVGEDIWDLVAFQISTGTQTILAQGLTSNPFMTFQEQPEGLVVNIYTNKGQPNQTLTQQWIVDGALYPFVPGYDPATLPFTPRSVTPFSNPLVSPPEIDDTVCPYAINWRPNGSSSSVPWTRLDFTLDYLGPLVIEFLAAAPSGLILGGAVEYQGWFLADALSSTFLGEVNGTSVAVAQALGLTVGGLVYVTGYPNAILDVFDPTKAWDPADTTNPSTPGAFSNGTTFSGVKTAARLAFGAQKNRLYMVGTRDRSGFGGGIGYYDITGNHFAGTFANLALYTTNLGLAVFDGAGEPNRVVFAGATSDSSTAQLVMYDLDLNEIERQTPIAGLAGTGQLFRSAERTVVVGLSRAGSLVYRWDVVSRTLLAQVDLSNYGTIGVACSRTDGGINVVAGSHLLQIDLVTLGVQDLGTLTGTVGAMCAQDGRIFLGIDSTLYVTLKVKPQGAKNVDRILFNEADPSLRTITIEIVDAAGAGVSGVSLSGATPATLKVKTYGGNYRAPANGAVLREVTGGVDVGVYELTHAQADCSITTGDIGFEITGGTPTIATCREPVVPIVPALRTVDMSSGLVTTIQTGLASASAVAAIPTTPLLTDDARLDNLDAAVSTRATTSAVAALPSAAAIASAVLTSSLGSGHTVQGALRRMDWINIGKMTGGVGVLATFFQYDGVTIGVQATQSVSAGTRSAASTAAGD